MPGCGEAPGCGEVPVGPLGWPVAPGRGGCLPPTICGDWCGDCPTWGDWPGWGDWPCLGDCPVCGDGPCPGMGEGPATGDWPGWCGERPGWWGDWAVPACGDWPGTGEWPGRGTGPPGPMALGEGVMWPPPPAAWGDWALCWAPICPGIIPGACWPMCGGIWAPIGSCPGGRGCLPPMGPPGPPPCWAPGMPCCIMRGWRWPMCGPRGPMCGG